MDTIVIARPGQVFVDIEPAKRSKKVQVAVNGLSRREFDALPGKTVEICLPDTPVHWKKRVSAVLTVYTNEAESAGL